MHPVRRQTPSRNRHAFQAWSFHHTQIRQKYIKTKQRITTQYFDILQHGEPSHMHHPRGLRPPPPRDVTGGLQQGLSEPPCGLRPRASPTLNLPDQGSPGKRNGSQTITIFPPHTHATVYILHQNRKNAREVDITVSYKAAPHKSPTVTTCIIPCQN